jgi:hypothetical protein
MPPAGVHFSPLAQPFFLGLLLALGLLIALIEIGIIGYAYVAGCPGTLIGADLLNLGIIHALGALIASIGGAGRLRDFHDGDSCGTVGLTPGGEEDGNLLQLDGPVQPVKSARVAMMREEGSRVSRRGGCRP